jgi:hypothetical protein
MLQGRGDGFAKGHIPHLRRVVEAAWPKPVLFFPARHDHRLVQTGDGYAAHIAGAIGVSTDAQASWWGSRGIGTVPHALIAAYGGNTVLAATTIPVSCTSRPISSRSRSKCSNVRAPNATDASVTSR